MRYNEELIVEGLLYGTADEAKEAQNEINGIKYVKSKTDMKNPHMVLNVYNKIQEKSLFKTPFGYSFLIDLREILLDCDEIDNSLIRPIKAPDFSNSIKSDDFYEVQKKTKIKKESKKNKSLKQEDEVVNKYKSRFYNTLVLLIAVIIALISLILIFTNSNNVNILNYKERLDRYYTQKYQYLVDWEDELVNKQETE